MCAITVRPWIPKFLGKLFIGPGQGLAYTAGVDQHKSYDLKDRSSFYSFLEQSDTDSIFKLREINIHVLVNLVKKSSDMLGLSNCLLKQIINSNSCTYY